ncbi:UNVERIFIED_CONTAM: hypothetical protein Sradi_4748900 [Sesamum radiatum]|uniref:DUF7875 domain-containing protein n=1 Tax=Sesamum radiatum TaxID=300843 RepID=A0AAW2MUE4_SESRA
MALRRMLGFSDGELMRSDAKPCSRLMRQTAGIFTVGEDWAFGSSAACIMIHSVPSKPSLTISGPACGCPLALDIVLSYSMYA